MAEPTMFQLDPIRAVERVREEVERSVRRALKGVDLLGAAPVSVGPSPRTVLHRQGTMEFVHYHPMTDEVYRVPVLLVMAPTNKGYVFDLAPGQSMVEYFLKRGYDIYMLDWNPPGPAEADLGLDDYALGFIPECIRRVQEDSGEEEINLVGYCAGGMLSSISQSLHPDGPVRSLACFTTPVDFRHMEIFRALVDQEIFDVDAFVERHGGIVPAQFISAGFDALRPASRVAGQIRLWDNLWNDEFVAGFRRMERWGNEMLPLPGRYFAETTKNLMYDNAFYEGNLRVGGEVVDLGRITVPFLHVAAKYDHIVPAACSAPLLPRVGSQDKEEIVLPGGHVSLVAGANAVRRMWPKLDAWLEGRSL